MLSKDSDRENLKFNSVSSFLSVHANGLQENKKIPKAVDIGFFNYIECVEKKPQLKWNYIYECRKLSKKKKKKSIQIFKSKNQKVGDSNCAHSIE